MNIKKNVMHKLVQHNLNVTERHNYEKTRDSHEPVLLTLYNFYFKDLLNLLL